MVMGNFLIFPTLKRKLADLTLSLESFFKREGFTGTNKDNFIKTFFR
jgi:hypothetical protein